MSCFLLYHSNLMRVDQSLFGFLSAHLIETLSAPHQYANAARWLAARARPHGCCSRRALYRPRLRAAALSSNPTWPGEAPDCVRAFQYDSFESRTMSVPHQSPSACQTELTGPSSGSIAAGDQRNLLVSVAIRSSWPPKMVPFGTVLVRVKLPHSRPPVL